MPRKLRLPIVTAFAFILLLTSCSKTNKQGKFIPKDAVFVMIMNGQSLSSKLPWDEVKKNELFQKMYADTTIPPFIKKALNDPDNSGIDVKNDLVFFVQKDSIGGYIALEGSVKDAEKFKTFNLDAIKGGSESEKDNIKMISHSEVCVGWNKDKFVYIFDAPQMYIPKRRSFMDDDVADERKPRDIGAACKTVFNLSEDNSLAKDEKFTALVNKEGDVYFWVNPETLYKEAAGFKALRNFKLDKFYEGNIVDGTVNFDNGKIKIDYKTYVSKDLKAIFKKYSGGSVDEAMLKNIPSKDVAAVFAIHFHPEAIKDIIALSGMDGLLNIALTEFDISLDDIIKSNKGDVILSVSDIKTVKDSVVFKGFDGKDNVYNTSKTKADIIFATAIGDKDAFNKLMKIAKKLGGDKLTQDAGANINYNNNDKYFAIGSSKDYVDKYLAGNSNNKFDFLSYISGNPVGGYVNLQYIMKAMENEMVADSSSRLMYNASVKMWDNIYIKGGQFEDGATSFTIEINLLDKSTNSLKQLNQYFGTLGSIADDKRMARKTNMYNYDNNVDSTTTTEPKVKLAPPPPQGINDK